MAIEHVAAFDVDGTLTRTDTLLPFLRRIAGNRRVAVAMLRSAPALVGMAVGRRSRDEVKQRLLVRLLRGRPEAEVRAAGAEYGAQVAARIRPRMRARLAWHHDQGHRVVLVSASPDIYLHAVARSLGADLLSTRLEVDGDGRLTGRFLGGNCRGAEKARRLHAWLGDADVELWAYGNSGGDEDMLAMAEHATRVRRGRPGLIP
jgi:phosphatidylglycerophosphatase C